MTSVRRLSGLNGSVVTAARISCCGVPGLPHTPVTGVAGAEWAESITDREIRARIVGLRVRPVDTPTGLPAMSPRLPAALLAALRAGDSGAAMTAWESVRAFEELRADDGSADNVSVVKEAMAQLGLARRDVRPPCRVLPGDRPDPAAGLIAGWKEEGWL